ncbi:MAG: shikimate kinase [Candidatus Promineifilaceae bacterium]
MMARNVILTGFMGTGKTTVGLLLAERLGYGFVDTDGLIEERYGRSIPDIFAELGEDAFREMEGTVALELAGQGGLVISTGGRLMLDAVNAAELGRNGRVFCLTASPEEILMRISADGGAERPLLAGSDSAERIAGLLAERREGYGQFEQVVTDGKTADEVVSVIVTLLGVGK